MNILIIFFIGFFFGKYLESIVENLVQIINAGLGIIYVKLKYYIEKNHLKTENLSNNNQKNPIGFMSDEDQ